MFKCLPVALLGVVMFSCDSLEAQLFRRFVTPRPPAVQQAVPNCRTQPARPYAVQPQAYYRRVQVAPGRFALVPVQPNGATNQFQQQAVAPQQPTAAPQQPTAAQQRPTAAFPQANSVLVRQAQRAPVASPNVVPQTQQRRYRRVTVYNPRTGQRSVRLIPIPPSTLAQQPYVYGQQGAGQAASNPQVVRGTFITPPQNAPTQNLPAQTAGIANSSNEIRLDSQVQLTTFEEPPVVLNQPQPASVIPVSPQPQPASVIPVSPEPQPAITPSLDQTDGAPAIDTSGQHSVLDFTGDASADSAGEIRLELDAPAN